MTATLSHSQSVVYNTREEECEGTNTQQLSSQKPTSPTEIKVVRACIAQTGQIMQRQLVVVLGCSIDLKPHASCMVQGTLDCSIERLHMHYSLTSPTARICSPAISAVPPPSMGTSATIVFFSATRPVRWSTTTSVRTPTVVPSPCCATSTRVPTNAIALFTTTSEVL